MASAAAAVVPSPEAHINLDAIDAVFSNTSGFSGLLGSLDVKCELLVTGGLSPRAKGSSSFGPSGVHTFVQLTSQKSGCYPNEVIFSVDDLTGEIECLGQCLSGIDHWKGDHASFKVDLGKKSISTKKADEIKAMIREHNRSPSHDTAPSFKVSKAALEILGFNTTPVGPIDTLFNIFEQFAGYKDPNTWDLTAFADRISDASKHRGATHAEFDAAIASCLGDGKTIDDLKDQDPPFYAAIHTIEHLFMLFMVSHSSISRPVPSAVNRAESCQFPFRPPGDDNAAASSHDITYSKRTLHNFGDVDQLLYARSERQQLLQSGIVAKQAAETAFDAVTRLGRHYSAYAECGRIAQVMQHLDAVHDELFGPDGLIEKWTNYEKRHSMGFTHHNRVDPHYTNWVERYGTLCKLVTLLCKQAQLAGERGQADPEIMNKIGTLVQTMMMFMDVSVIAPDDSIEFCGLYHFFSKMETDDAGKKMTPCPVKPWEGDKGHCKDAYAAHNLFYSAVGTPCKAFLRVKELHKISKEELLEAIFAPINPAKDVHDCFKEEETAESMRQIAAEYARKRA